MEHLKLHDIWLYLIAIFLFGIFLLLIYIIYRCSDRMPSRKRRKESVLQFNVEGSAQNLMANFAEWKGELPTYVSHWSFQDECDDDLEWKRHLSLKSHCVECEKLLQEEQNSNTIVANIDEIGLGHITAV